MSEINLYNLSLDELKEQARILGIVVRGNPGADTLREKIRNAVMIEPPADQKQAPKEDPDRKKGWITIVIAEDEQDQQPVYVGVNGKSYFIRRGEPVPVPPEVVEVLNNAKQTVFNGKDGTSKTVPTYPFQIEK
ncbi:MAG: hypothetical protein CL494_05275 [Actinobacteria bacterium]|nr:hypothetical protein [Actinomycetota bacterium]|tara:strand:+ start:2147 stop:2548 length:402 start_codon:yes stop_codon:yes gene_type:complete